jgi:methylmalonyl-CoA/ethylmalonyl-CoA epimerase
VKDLDRAMKVYRDAFGIEPSLVYQSEYTKAKIAFFPVGEIKIELIQPVDPSSVIAKFLIKKGEGIHHIAYRVKDVDNALKRLDRKGIRLVDKASRKVRENESIAFLHPKSTNGVLTELIQKD